MSRTDFTTVRTIDMGRNQVVALRPAAGTVVRILHGRAWITQAGAARDVVLGAGSEIALRAGREAVIEGLGPGRLEIVERRGRGTLAALAARVAGAARRVASGAARWRARMQLGEVAGIEPVA